MSSIGWVFGVLRQNGIDTKGMSEGEAFDELEKLRQQVGTITQIKNKVLLREE